VTRHATASTAGSNQKKATIALVVMLALGAVLLLAPSAFAATVTDRPLLFSFNGSDTSAGTIYEMRGGIAVDESSGDVYVPDLKKEVIDKFNADGSAADFSASGESSLDGSETPDGEFNFGFNSEARVAVDDSPVNTGRIYVANESHVDAFSPAGTFLWRLPTASDGACGVAVDTEGHLWLGDSTNGMVREYASTGAPPAEIASFAASGACGLDVAKNGDVYVIEEGSTLSKYVGGAFSSTIDTGVGAVAVDQSSLAGHVFSLHGESGVSDFSEFDSSGTLVGTFGVGVLYEGNSIAYNSTLDRVYVGQFSSIGSGQLENIIRALGPVATGTVPDPTTEAASEIGVSKAQLNGKVNPQSVPNAYFFEWKQGTASFGWRRAQSSTPQSLPEDSTEHAVFSNITQLNSNTTYQVRLVGLNTATGLRSVGNTETFTTATAAPPAATIDEPSGVTTSRAEISGTVNSRGDFASTWSVQLSTDPACASGFSSRPAHNLESDVDAPIAVSEELMGLLAHQHYCVRISATNSGGTTNSEVKEFTTESAVPSQVFTAFAAPRTDTTARLNGRVDPEGAPLTYRFEYSKDGGATWIELPEGKDTSEAREQIVVGEELTGLSPSTTYSYRFSVENEVGEPVQQGGVKIFSTRSSAAMSPPARGIELVNSPDKGNQRVFELGVPLDKTPLMAADGEKVIWSVKGGAPGGASGTGASFLAKRTPEGWKSTGLVPPAAEQLGGGELAYTLDATTPDLGKFIFRVARSKAVGFPDNPTVVRLDESLRQDVLNHYDALSVLMSELELTDDGAHVVIEDPTGHELEDIGDGTPEVVSLMPDESPAECLRRGREGGEGMENNQWRPGYHIMSATDASRVYFEAQPNGGCSGPDGLYVRNRQTGETTLIDPGASGKSPELIRVTPSGRSAYFLSPSQLDPADNNADTDIYRWDEASGESTCLTCVVPDAKVSGRVMISDDFSHVYFESTSQLISGLGQVGDRNVYSLSGGSLSFVADPLEYPTLNPDRFPKLSEDGEVLLFRANAARSLTADRVASSCVDRLSGENGPCVELYRYDDRDGSLECISCNQAGTTVERVGTALGIENIESRLSGDGSTIAFSTSEGLVRSDVNHDVDIYEWRGGVLRLITDGVSPAARGLSTPEVLAADRTGDNLLFAVVPPRGSLTGFEQDGQLNLYDARVGGGFEPPSPPVHCSEDSCQGPLQPAPTLQPPSSSSFSGKGNLAPRATKRHSCARKRGKARRRCMRRHARHRKHGGHHKRPPKHHSHKAGAHHNSGRAK
jgi:hypothetical protein